MAPAPGAPSKGDTDRLNFDDPDAVNLLRIILRGIGQPESEDDGLYSDELPDTAGGDASTGSNEGANDQDSGHDDLPSPREPRNYRPEEAEKQSLDIHKAIACFEDYIARLAEAGITVAEEISQIPEIMKSKLAERSPA